MSEHVLIGRKPKGPIGKDLMFHSLDSWFFIDGLLATIVENFDGNMHLDSASAESLAIAIRAVISSGLAEDVILEFVAEDAYDDDDPGSPESQVEYYVGHLDQLATFLEQSGGCDPE